MSSEKSLIKRAKEGDRDAVSELIQKNLYMAHKIASKYINSYQEYEDLVNDGIVGMLIAIKKYDLKYNNKFSTFAYYYIRNEIRRSFIKDRPGGIHISEMFFNDSIKARHVADLIREMEDRDLTNKEMKMMLGVNHNINAVCTNLTDQIENKFLQFEQDKTDINEKLTIEIVKNAITKEEFDLLADLFGLDGHEEKMGIDIAKESGLTPHNISYRKRKILKKLSTKLNLTKLK
jgi:RNA polymerase sporulation-specific sigma factor